MNGSQFRCVVEDNGCTDISDVVTLNVYNAVSFNIVEVSKDCGAGTVTVSYASNAPLDALSWSNGASGDTVVFDATTYNTAVVSVVIRNNTYSDSLVIARGSFTSPDASGQERRPRALSPIRLQFSSIMLSLHRLKLAPHSYSIQFSSFNCPATNSPFTQQRSSALVYPHMFDAFTCPIITSPLFSFLPHAPIIICSCFSHPTLLERYAHF